MTWKVDGWNIKDGFNCEKVGAHGRGDQANLRVDAEHYPEPDRVPAQSDYDGVEDGQGNEHQYDGHRFERSGDLFRRSAG